MRRGYKVKDAETRTGVHGEVFVRRVLWADSVDRCNGYPNLA
jgi:hypothetical protein